MNYIKKNIVLLLALSLLIILYSLNVYKTNRLQNDIDQSVPVKYIEDDILSSFGYFSGEFIERYNKNKAQTLSEMTRNLYLIQDLTALAGYRDGLQFHNEMYEYYLSVSDIHDTYFDTGMNLSDSDLEKCIYIYTRMNTLSSAFNENTKTSMYEIYKMQPVE